jgi:chromosomal replication initiation ATPase DnaA
MTERQITIDNKIFLIKQEVARFFKMSVKELEGESRKIEATKARHVAFHISRGLKEIPFFKVIGSHFGNRDHSTVVHGVNKIDDMLSVYPKFRIEYNEVLMNCKDSLRVNVKSGVSYVKAVECALQLEEV